MAKRVRWVRVLGALAVVLVVAYWWLLVQVPAAGGDFRLDLAEVRRLARSLPGDRATAVRVERVADFQFPGAIVRAGDGWGLLPMAVYSYQLVFPTHTAIVDTALKETLPGGHTDLAAFGRVGKALHAADLIVITHEHGDHIGGLLAQPDLKALLPAARLTEEQVSHPELTAPAKIPPGAFDGYQRLAYDRYLAVAPGVVLIRAPGHTPGSQIVYVQRADGAELLFLGDVAWREPNVEAARERPRLITLIIGEDRPQVTRQLEELQRIARAEPGVRLVPGHDPTVIAELVARRLLVERFPD